MSKSILSLQTLPDICSFVKQDCNDTMSKISSRFSELSSVLLMNPEVGERVEEATAGLLTQLNNIEVVCGDGDVIFFELNGNGDLCYKTSIDGADTLTPFIAYDSEEQKYRIATDKLQSINGEYWETSEVIQSIADTYTINDIMYRAADLISAGEYSIANFNAKCSDILNNISGNPKALYSTILSCVTEQNPNGFAQIINDQYKAILDSEVIEGTIEFAKNDYYVEGFCGTVMLQAVGSVIQAAGLLIASVSKIAGLVMLGVGAVLNAVGSVVGRLVGTNATINYQSLFRLFAVPIFQKTITISDNSRWKWVKDDVDIRGVVKYICPNFVLYAWQNSDNTYSLECFLNCSLIPKFGTDDHVDNFDNGDPLYGYPTVKVNGWGFATSEDGIGNNVIDQLGNMSNYGLFPSDEEIRKRVGMSLLYMAALVHVAAHSGSTVNNLTSEDWISAVYPVDNSTPYYSAGGVEEYAIYNADKMIYRYRNQNGSLPSWADMVNKIIPTFQDNDLCMKGCLSYIQATRDSDFTTVLYDISDKGDFWITPPNVTVEALVFGVIAGIAVAAAAVAGYFVTKNVIKKKVANMMTKKYAQVTSNYEAYVADPTDNTKFQAYYKSLKRYNLLARFTGYSSLSVTNGWESGDSTSSSILESINSTTKLVSESADVPSIDQVIKLIKA